MKFLPEIIFIVTMFFGLIWNIYNFYLMRTFLPILDAKNDELMLLRADTFFAKFGRSSIYMYASAFPSLFAKNRKRLKFFATEHERFLYKINAYLGLTVGIGLCTAFLLEWLLEHRIDWWW